MRDPSYEPLAGPEARPPRPPRPEEPLDVTRDRKAFTAAIRARAFTFLRAWSIGDDESALAALDSPLDAASEPWTRERLFTAREAYLAEHGALRLDPEARNLRHTHVDPAEDSKTWRVAQMLVDVEELNDWVAELEVDLDASRERGEPVLRLLRLESFV